MTEFKINVSEVEEMQMINDAAGLNKIFTKAHSTVTQGGVVSLVRQNADGSTYTFDELTTDSDIEIYKETVFKYL